VSAPDRLFLSSRPLCPHCKRPMHMYKREETLVRFRCAGYPACRTYWKTGAAAYTKPLKEVQ